MLFSTKTFLAVVAVLARTTAAAPAGSTDDALARQQDVAHEARQLAAVTAAAAQKRAEEAEAVEKRQFCDCPDHLECIDARVLAAVGTIAPMAHCVLPSTKRALEARAAEVEKRQQRAEAAAVEKREACACPDGFLCMVQSFEMLAVAPQTICVPSSTKRDLEARAAKAEKRQQRAESEAVEKRQSCDCPEGDVCLPNSPAEVFSVIMLDGPPDNCVSPTTKRDIEALTAEVQKRQVADAEGVEKPPACDCAEGETCSLIVMPITSNKAASTYMCM